MLKGQNLVHHPVLLLWSIRYQILHVMSTVWKCVDIAIIFVSFYQWTWSLCKNLVLLNTTSCMPLKICRSHTKGPAPKPGQPCIFKKITHSNERQWIKTCFGSSMFISSARSKLRSVKKYLENGKSTFSDMVISPLMCIQQQPSWPTYFSHLKGLI